MARYTITFRNSDTGLVSPYPKFNFFKKLSDLSAVTPEPAISEIGFGVYYFDYSPTFDIVFQIDGGPSIPTEEVRYPVGAISPSDGDLTRIRRILEGQWEIHTTGPFANMMSLYAPDGVTVFQRYELYNKDGVASVSDIFKRVPTLPIP